MFRLIIVLVFLIASVWFGIEVVKHPGFLLIVYQPWTIQMPLWFVLLSIFIFLALFYILINSIDRIHFLWFRFKNWLRFRREHQSYSKTQHGISALIEGRNKPAEQLLLSGVNQTIEPLINYLAAAKAAQEQGALERRDKYIQKAYQVAPGNEMAIGLTQAELELKEHQYEQALATLNHLHQKEPKQVRVLKLLEKVYVHIGDWQRLLLLVPYMRKAKILTSQQAELFEKNIYCEKINLLKGHSIEEIHQLWNNMPRYIKKNPDVVCAYVKQLLVFPEANNEIEELISQTLKHNWQAELVKIYSDLPFSNLNHQLVVGGAWLKMYGSRPELLLLLGKICRRVQLWGKAKDYFEKCIEQEPNMEAYLEYGRLLEELDESSVALHTYREGLEKQVQEQALKQFDMVK